MTTMSRPFPATDPYNLWLAGDHEAILASGPPDFLNWAANADAFPKEAWTRQFLRVGKLKREMRRRVGKRTFGWSPMIELRMPAGCNAACRYCNGALVREDPEANTTEALLRSLDFLRLPETIALCAEWGDPCLHPEIIDAVNARIEKDWLVTRYMFLTNLSVIGPVLRALPYTRNLLVHFTMSRPAHARGFMGFKSERMFEIVLNNLRTICALKAQGKISGTIRAQFIIEPKTVAYAAENYALLRDVEGLDCCRYKPTHAFRNAARRSRDVIKVKTKLAGMKGMVPHVWVD